MQPKTKPPERPHIVWALFPPLCWMLWGGAGLGGVVIAYAPSGVPDIVGVYSIAIGCALGSPFAGIAFRRVCGYFESRSAR